MRRTICCCICLLVGICCVLVKTRNVQTKTSDIAAVERWMTSLHKGSTISDVKSVLKQPGTYIISDTPPTATNRFRELYVESFLESDDYPIRVMVYFDGSGCYIGADIIDQSGNRIHIVP